MYKYRVVGDTVTYGGPKKFSVDNWHLSGATLMDCIAYVKDKVEDPERIDIDSILSTKEDPMGTYTRYLIQRDNSIETVWLSLSLEERKEIFKLALDAVDASNSLYDKILGVEV